MSRRVVAPVLLLLAAACSMAAVFAVHRIESRGGPLAQPSASTFFSPDGDGVQDEAEVRFTTRQPESVTVDVVDVDGRRVATLARDERVDGEVRMTWDGRGPGHRVVADGPYRVRIRRAGDDRTYSPTAPVTVDTAEPVGVLDRATLERGELRGLAFLAAGERLDVLDADGQPAGATLRQFRPDPAARSAQPLADVPAGTFPVRFTIAIAGTPDRIDVVDKAGNRRRVFPDRGVSYEAKG